MTIILLLLLLLLLPVIIHSVCNPSRPFQYSKQKTSPFTLWKSTYLCSCSFVCYDWLALHIVWLVLIMYAQNSDENLLFLACVECCSVCFVWNKFELVRTEHSWQLCNGNEQKCFCEEHSMLHSQTVRMCSQKLPNAEFRNSQASTRTRAQFSGAFKWFSSVFDSQLWDVYNLLQKPLPCPHRPPPTPLLDGFAAEFFWTRYYTVTWNANSRNKSLKQTIQSF